jgi:ABC-type cobalamin/Fe3+-siderophores transport system ATPase subunit
MSDGDIPTGGVFPGVCLRTTHATSEVGRVFNPIVVAKRDSWSDFGYVVSATVGFRTTSTIEWFEAKFALKGQPNFMAVMEDMLHRSDPARPLSKLKMPFACLLNDTRSYAAVGRLLGAERGRQLLASLNDVALLRARGAQVPDWPGFFDDPVFQRAIVRASESFEAYKHGARALAAGMDTESDTCSGFSVRVAGRKGPRLKLDFSFDRDNHLRGRIAVLIGANGCGKTSTLATLARALNDRASRLATFSNRPEANQVLVFAHPMSLRTFEPKKVDSAAGPRLFALEPTDRRGRANAERSVLIDLARSQFYGQAAVGVLDRALRDEFEELVAYVPVVANGTDLPQRKGLWTPLGIWIFGGEKQQLEAIANLDRSRRIVYTDASGQPRKLSLGQAVFIQFAMRALAFAGPGSIIIVDEPENYLHPNLISQFMRLLNKVLTTSRSVAIVATHSPFVVREVSSDLVQVIRVTPDGAECNRPRLQTLGANVASIASEVFNDTTPTHLHEELLEAADITALSFEEVLEKYKADLSIEAMMLLRQRIDDL